MRSVYLRSRVEVETLGLLQVFDLEWVFDCSIGIDVGSKLKRKD